MPDKGDRKTGDSTYGQITIRNAVCSNTQVYLPLREAGATSAEEDFENL